MLGSRDIITAGSLEDIQRQFWNVYKRREQIPMVYEFEAKNLNEAYQLVWSGELGANELMMGER